ncbi:MAG: SRPBCC domain-containing protein [Actinomycetota bacterium]|nr:SRPBCC domain-containing protein [Actinomycetota bacterium]
MSDAEPAGAPVLRISRRIKAPRERVFAAWTDPEEIPRWFGAPGNDFPAVEVDLRVGGGYRFVMQAPGGFELALAGTYLEVEPPNRLVYSFGWDRDLPFPGGEQMRETRVTVEFLDRGAETEIVLTHEGFPNDDSAAFHDAGWTVSLDRLSTLVE